MDKRKRNIMIAAIMLIGLILGASQIFGPILEQTVDINSLGTLKVYRYINAAQNQITSGQNIDISTTIGSDKITIVFEGTYKNSQTRCTLVRSDGQFMNQEYATLLNTGMQWIFYLDDNLRPDKYHFAFDAQYSETKELSGQSISFFVIGGNGIPDAPTFQSKPIDSSTLVNEPITISWVYLHLMNNEYNILVDGEVKKSGSGNSGGNPTTASISITETEISVHTIKLDVFVDSKLAGSDSMILSIVGSSITTTNTTTTTTTGGGGGGTTTTTNSTTQPDNEPYDYSILMISVIAAGIVLAIVAIKKVRK